MSLEVENENTQKTLKRFIGLRNIVTSRSQWKYLFLYEIDGTDPDYRVISMIATVSKMETSYVVYRTKNGYHLVGLTPINAQKWGYWFQTMQNSIPEYFSGQTLRLSLKEGEKQELIYYSFRYPYLERLARIYIKRFGIKKEDIPLFGSPPAYSCVFEKYWTEKI
jgi:hypothetical protein